MIYVAIGLAFGAAFGWLLVDAIEVFEQLGTTTDSQVPSGS